MANWFIALPVTPRQLPEGVLESLPPGLNRFPPEDLHVTVAFLGGVGEDRARAAWGLAGRIDAGPFTVSLGPPAALGNPRRPSAFGLDLGSGGDTVDALIGHWRDRLRVAAGQSPERREPRAHLTLARAPRRAGPAIRERAERWVETYSPPRAELTLDRIALYTWSDDRPRRLFRIVAARTLPCVDTGNDAGGAG